MKPHQIDTSEWTEEDRQRVRAEAIYAGFDVIEDDFMTYLVKNQPKIRRAPKERFFA